MKTGLLILLTFSLFAKLSDSWQKEILTPSKISAKMKSFFSTKQVLFVTGYMTEGIDIVTDYFEDNAEVLKKDFGIHSFILEQKSQQSIETNADLIYFKILELYEKNNKKPIILIGHSKGGAEALFTALQDYDLLLKGIVEKVVIIQGAVLGSPVATYFTTDFLGKLTSPLKGLTSLNEQVMNAKFQERTSKLKMALSPFKFNLVSQKIYYVRSYKNRSDVSPILYFTHRYLEKTGGKNDGLLLLKDQYLEQIGVDLCVLYADHADLTVTSPLSTMPREARYAFTRALMSEIYSY